MNDLIGGYVSDGKLNNGYYKVVASKMEEYATLLNPKPISSKG